MRYDPHEYQSRATGFIESHPECALLLSMGLGKTVITLTALQSLMFDSFEVGRALVVAPLRVGRDTWPEELAKWEHLKGMRMAVAIGTERERVAALESKADVYVINRENLDWMVERYGTSLRFDMIVIDELSSFKNGRSKRFRSLMRIRPAAKRVVGLTGTPAGNGLMDLWAEFKCIDMGRRLGRFITHYREEFFVPDKRNGQVVFSYRPKPGASERIFGRLSDITVSMKALDHLDMPKLIEVDREVRMSEEEARGYAELVDSMTLELKDKELTAANAAVLTAKLAQYANGSVLDDEGNPTDVHSRKLDALEDAVEAANGQPILVAYWYRRDLERIEERLDRMGVEHMRISSKESMERWNSGSLPVGLIHPASAGHGLNLQKGGDTIVWFGLTWSLELYQQTVARLWRQGQESGTVVVIRIVAEGTVDSAILSALSGKTTVQDALIDAMKWKGGSGR